MKPETIKDIPVKEIIRDEITAEDLDLIRRMAEKFNKQLKRMKMPQVQVQVIDERFVQSWVEGGVYRTREFTTAGVSKLPGLIPGRQIRKVYDVQIVHPDIPNACVEGYELVAVIQPVLDDLYLEEGVERLVTRTKAGVGVDIERFRDGVSYCSECRAKRKRKHLLVVKKEGGKPISLGGNCIHKYVPGGANELALLAKIQHMAAEKRAPRQPNGSPNQSTQLKDLWWNIIDVIACTIAVQEVHGGYVSIGEAKSRGIPSTKNRVSFYMNPSNQASSDWKRLWARLADNRERYVKDANAIWKWGIELKPKSNNIKDYEHNLLRAFRAGAVGYKTLGLIVSAHRAKQLAENKASQPQGRWPSINEWVGKANQPLTYQSVQVNGLINIRTSRGFSWLVSVTTPAGHVLKWWAGAERPQLAEGELISLVCKVKARQEYRGRKSTLVRFARWKKHKTMLG